MSENIAVIGCMQCNYPYGTVHIYERANFNRLRSYKADNTTNSQGA